MDDFHNASVLVADFKNKLDVILARDSKRHMMDAHIPQGVLQSLEELQSVLKDAIDAIEWEPGDEDLCPGEPPMTSAEMHNEAWKQHVQMHS